MELLGSEKIKPTLNDRFGEFRATNTVNQFKSVHKDDQRSSKRDVEFGTDEKVAESSNFAPSPDGMERRDKAETARNKNVVNCLYHNRDALFRLVCFPWAGGNSYHFAKWGQNISSLVEVHATRLAGRESQLQEPFPKDIYQVVDEVVCALLPVLQGENFAFFGHSLGSYLAFMTALHLKEKCKLEPVHLFVSGVNPPHSKARYCIPEESLSEEQITSQLKKPGGTPKDFFEDDTCLQFPRLLADVYLGSNYIFDTPSEVPLSCDLTCFTGSEDIPEDFKAWGDVTSGSCDTHVLPGNHFYLMEPSNEIFIKNYITKTLEASMIHYI